LRDVLFDLVFGGLHVSPFPVTRSLYPAQGVDDGFRRGRHPILAACPARGACGVGDDEEERQDAVSLAVPLEDGEGL
jgi:hypothetical protein